MKKSISYTYEIDETWSDKAVDTVSASAVPDALRPVVLDLEGDCPRCGHHMADEHWLITFSGVASLDRDDAIRAVDSLRDAGAVQEPVLPAEFTVQCNCGQAHPDPLGRSGLKGCGAVWRMRFEKSQETE